MSKMIWKFRFIFFVIVAFFILSSFLLVEYVYAAICTATLDWSPTTQNQQFRDSAPFHFNVLVRLVNYRECEGERLELLVTADGSLQDIPVLGHTLTIEKDTQRVEIELSAGEECPSYACAIQRAGARRDYYIKAIGIQPDTGTELKGKSYGWDCNGDCDTEWQLLAVRQIKAQAGQKWICQNNQCVTTNDSNAPNSFPDAALCSQSGCETSGRGTGQDIPFGISNPIDAESIEDLANGIANAIFNIVLVVAPIIIIYAGIKFMLAKGEPAKVTEAKKALTYALIGLAVVFIGKGFIALIRSILDLGS